jgi:ElaB/YqjD/DUF883 family membrane-anchored ribosome-binding protein
MNDIKDRIKSGIDTAADKAKTATDQVARGVDKAGQHLHQAGQQADHQMNKAANGSTIDTVKDTAQRAVNAVGDYAGQAQHKVSEWADDAQNAACEARKQVVSLVGDAGDVANDFGKEISSMVRKYPVQALLVGFGVGMLLGRVTRA